MSPGGDGSALDVNEPLNFNMLREPRVHTPATNWLGNTRRSGIIYRTPSVRLGLEQVRKCKLGPVAFKTPVASALGVACSLAMPRRGKLLRA